MVFISAGCGTVFRMVYTPNGRFVLMKTIK
jgi:hypothetical protein